ncbi:MAG: CPBP family intramembrane metalloprotease [Bacteroidales bacterium]|nr:CPBP family intramembrane metalloprotease [Bacteroidales bacterium]
MIQYFKYYKPGLGQSWLLVGILLVGGIIAGFLLPDGPQSLSYAINMLFPLAWAWLMGQQAKETPTEPVPVNAPDFGKISPALLLILGTLATFCLSVLTDPLVSVIPMPDSIKAIFEKVFMDTPLWDMVIATCILAPLLEEFLCRGLMLRGMLQRMSPGKAIAWSSFLFAFMHMNPWQAIPAFVLGAMFGWIYWRTRCLWVTIFLHFFNNGLSTLMSRCMPDVTMDTGWKDILPPAVYWILFAACVVALAISLYLIHEKTLPAEVPPRVET